MPSTTSLLDKIQRDFPRITFVKSDTFRWSPKERTVYYADASDTASLLHETAHAALGHGEYASDIELLQMERDAWDLAAGSLSKKYGTAIDRETAEDMLDTYRNWLHDRSVCPACQATGVQSRQNHYSCLACGGAWRVNEARTCALRRYKLSSPNKNSR